MRASTRIGVILLVLTCAASYAVPPAYDGRLGNPEEPALRPYKAFWQGARAIVDRSKHSFVEGNMKFPLIGSVETFQGLRRGLVDCSEYTYRSMQGSLPPRGQEYKQPGKLNRVIEEDPALRNGADFVVGAGLLGPAQVGVTVTQKAVNRLSFTDPEEREARREAAQDVWKARRARQREAAKPAYPVSPVKRAQRRYLGDRAINNTKPRGTGNLLKLDW